VLNCTSTVAGIIYKSETNKAIKYTIDAEGCCSNATMSILLRAQRLHASNRFTFKRFSVVTDYAEKNITTNYFTTTNQLRQFSMNSDMVSSKQYSENIKRMTNEQLSNSATIPGFNQLIHSPPRNKESLTRNALVGRVVSDKMSKTVNVAIERYRMVPKYRKRMKYTKKFMAHDEREVCKEGDLVMIIPCQRLSRRKHFMVHEIVRAKGQL